MFDQIDELAVNAVRTLSIDAVQKANSGHGLRALDKTFESQP